MTLIQIAATLGVGRSSLVRALAQTSGNPAIATVGIGPEQTALQLLPERVIPSAELEEQPSGEASASVPVPVPEVQLLGKSTRRGAELEELSWPAGYSPACPSCALPTTGVEEQYARIAGQREPIAVALAQPCGCLIDDHVADLYAQVPAMPSHRTEDLNTDRATAS